MDEDVPASAEPWSDAFLPAGLTATATIPLGGGVNSAWRCTLADGREVVIKASTVLPSDLLSTEAAALQSLRSIAGLAVPDVIATTPHSLVLEALDPSLPDDAEFWAATGRTVARLHTHASDWFGWPVDGWFGLVRQRNTPTGDGYEFFAEHRILSFLGEPRADEALDHDDRRGLERICARLPELVRDTGARLNHGDLWRNNLVRGHDGAAVFIDPAVSYCWPEADLCLSRGLPEAFFAGYVELRPLDPDWHEQADVLYLRQLLSGVAHFGADPHYLPRLRDTIARFR